MASVREWRRPAGAGCWPRGARRAASACQPEHVLGTAARGARIAMTARPPTLKNRADFLRVAATRARAVRPGLILQAAPCPEAAEGVRVGYTASRRVGNAGVRNR